MKKNPACGTAPQFTLPVLPEAISGAPVAGNPSDALPIRILFIEQVSQLLGKSVATVRTFATCKRYLHLIPRPFKMPHSRRLCWYESDVLKWIESARPAEPPPPRRRPGRPTKAEQVARQRWAERQAS
jgi:predicted DNA-binding transcriptional regulator AlpA